MTTEPRLESVLDVFVGHCALFQLFLVLFELPAFPCHALRADPPVHLAGVGQLIVNLQMLEVLAQLKEPRLLFVDDQAEPCRDYPDRLQDTQKEVLARVKYPDVVGVSRIIVAACHDLAVVVYRIGMYYPRAL